MLPVSPAWGEITGISPPARKLAVSPDMAIRLGSASTVAWLCVASRSINPETPPEDWTPPAAEAVPPIAWMVEVAKPVVGPAPKSAMLLTFCQLIPTRFKASRLTSAILTRSCTCVGASMRILLITLVALPFTFCSASRRASSAISAERTVPVSTIVSPWLSKFTPLPGWIASSDPFIRLIGEVTCTIVLSSTRS